MWTSVEPGLLVDLALAFLIVEVVVLMAYRTRTGHGIGASMLVPNLGAGACLMLGVRFASRGAGAGWVAWWLLCALGCHVVDLALRWTAAAAEDRQPDPLP